LRPLAEFPLTTAEFGRYLVEGVVMFLGPIVLAVVLTPLCYLEEGGRESCRNTSTIPKGESAKTAPQRPEKPPAAPKPEPTQPTPKAQPRTRPK
jgi:hypothetical protein